MRGSLGRVPRDNRSTLRVPLRSIASKQIRYLSSPFFFFSEGVGEEEWLRHLEATRSKSPKSAQRVMHGKA